MSQSTVHERTPGGIAYDDVGAAGDTALLFLPGWCGPRDLFDPLVSRIAPMVRCLAVDWRGHGGSAPADGDFGLAELVDDACSVIEQSGVTTVVPVSIAHAGWVSIELRRRLGAERVPRLAILDWMVLGAPEPFLDALRAMADPPTTRQVVDQVSDMWLAGLDIPDLGAYVATMTGFPDEMWIRAAREIAAAFARHPVPLAAIAELDPTPQVVHLYAQPSDSAFLFAQEEFARQHPWFGCERLPAASHFPMYEVPDAIAARLTEFARTAALGVAG